MSLALKPPRERPRKFLVVIDKSPECHVAVRFATRRAQATGGRVTLLCAVQPADIQQWRGVEEIMKDEARQDAESLIYEAAKAVNELSGIVTILARHGKVVDYWNYGHRDVSSGTPMSKSLSMILGRMPVGLNSPTI